MGFTPKFTIYRLEFEDADLAGLEVRMRAAKLGLLFGVGEAASIQDRAKNGEELTGADADVITEKFEQLADHLVSWNVEDEDGVPVPATLAGLKTLEMPLVMRIFVEWQSAMKGVTPPLSSGSSNGASVADLMTIPMQPIPASLAS